MAHYAFLDENNIVIEVIVGTDDNEGNINWEEKYGNFRGKKCKKTSYNTIGGIHNDNGIPFRKNYAGIGYYYDEERDAFIPPKPFNSWLLNENTCLWEPPIQHPTDGNSYQWNEENQEWILNENK